MDEKTIARFWSKVDRRGPDECWPWLGATPRGYGHIKVGAKMIRAHRAAWEIAHGPIPPGKHVLHHCDNPPCVHAERCLFLGTHADNVADMVAKGRARGGTGERNVNAKITSADAHEIFVSYRAGKANQYELARQYGITQAAVWYIVNGRTWVRATGASPQTRSASRQAAT